MIADKKVLLISVQRDLQIIGLRYIHYSLLKAGYHSVLLNLPNFADRSDNPGILKQIGEFVRGTAPIFIGFSVMSTEFNLTRHLSIFLKKECPSVPIVWGGIHPTISPETCLPYTDYVCMGEGERTAVELAGALTEGRAIDQIGNLAYRTGTGDVRHNSLYPLIDNLDELPSYDHVPVNGFVQRRNGLIRPIDTKLQRKYGRHRGVVYDSMASRGCPFACTYCCNNVISQIYGTRKTRRRSVENVILEIERAIRSYPDIQLINFQDDCFIACSREWLIRFCDDYQARIKKPFQIRAIPGFLDRERLAWLKDVGLVWVLIGLESGSDRVCREVYNRKLLRKDFLEATRLVNEFRLVGLYDVILDNPFESDREKMETIRALMEIPKPFLAEFFSLTFYPGTELYRKAMNECPDRVRDAREKDYKQYENTIINKLTRLAAYLPTSLMELLLKQYLREQRSYTFLTFLFMCRVLGAIVFEPIAHLRLLKLSEGGSFLNALRKSPIYFRTAFEKYLKQFKWGARTN